jgi:hypothetical protein
MGTLRPGTGRHSLLNTFLAFGCALLLTLPAMAAQVRSCEASANMRIRIRVVPTVATAAPESRNRDSNGSILYSLPVNQELEMTRQITVRPMRGDELMKMNGSSHSGNQAPALLETVTIVGE